ncbi:MAG: KEOPS complex subunit Pcc1 [Candidatus Altiarchaeota archaeon]
MNELDIKISMPASDAKIIASALALEAGSDMQRRSAVKVTPLGDGLQLDITADDLHALRASLNTYLRWVMMAGDIVR